MLVDIFIFGFVVLVVIVVEILIGEFHPRAGKHGTHFELLRTDSTYSCRTAAGGA